MHSSVRLVSTYINVVSVEQPNAEYQLEENSEAEEREPGQKPSTGAYLNAIVDAETGPNQCEKVN